jgi:hypothetical protein
MRQCWGVVELALWTLDANMVANFEEGYMAGDIAFLVRLGSMRTRATE